MLFFRANAHEKILFGSKQILLFSDFLKEFHWEYFLRANAHEKKLFFRASKYSWKTYFLNQEYNIRLKYFNDNFQIIKKTRANWKKIRGHCTPPRDKTRHLSI